MSAGVTNGPNFLAGGSLIIEQLDTQSVRHRSNQLIFTGK